MGPDVGLGWNVAPVRRGPHERGLGPDVGVGLGLDVGVYFREWAVLIFLFPFTSGMGVSGCGRPGPDHFSLSGSVALAITPCRIRRRRMASACVADGWLRGKHDSRAK